MVVQTQNIDQDNNLHAASHLLVSRVHFNHHLVSRKSKPHLRGVWVEYVHMLLRDNIPLNPNDEFTSTGITYRFILCL